MIQDLYKAGSDISKEINSEWLGDYSGRSICRRTGHGFKNTFGISDEAFHDNLAVEAVHIVGIWAIYNFAKNRSEKALAILLLVFGLLIMFYHLGKEKLI